VRIFDLSTISRSRLIFVFVLLAIIDAAAQEPSGARSMFHSPSTGTIVATPLTAQPTPGAKANSAATPAVVRYVGIHYWLDLDGVGPVADTRVFQTGQRIRLNVRSNCDGYLAIWTLGSGGAATLMIPSDRQSIGIPLKQGQPFVTPAMRFNAPATDERLILFFARQKSGLPSMETLRGDAALAAFRGIGARDLSIETETASSGDVGTYVVNRLGGPVSKDIILRHVTGGGE
jgi:hypothetical protein